jgi:lysophospholipase L1-like esterase
MRVLLLSTILLAGAANAADAPATQPANAPYLLLDANAVPGLRLRFNPKLTHPCEVQVVGDSISESFLFLNPLTTDGHHPDMAYANPTHCRLFGQNAVFTDVLQTAASGMTAGWGLEGEKNWGGVRNLHYPFTYNDLDAAKSRIGKREAYPELATILFGTNDLRRYVSDHYQWDKSPGGEIDARKKYLGHLEAMARWFLDHGTIPVLVTIPPGNYPEWDLKIGGGEALGPRWCADIRKLGQRIGVPVFDVEQLMLDQGDWKALFSDGVHPNEKGYKVINEAFYKVYGDLRHRVLQR